ncbi:DUF3744 domain-containing protein [uncultured Trichococcus sp.]|uniref:ABC transporter ATP-binding protein n=1 Tax=uncultured Trichococcus sp. TaxID=189665 RepID=UPI002A1882D1|nr:DUF3744 domain-containing protein [uncultured Trichococcus sp.]
MRRPLISFQNFSFTYSDQKEPTLEELNVTIYEGEKILVLGPSGSGKTTFARCLTGVLPSEENGDASGNILFHHQVDQTVAPFEDFLPNEMKLVKNSLIPHADQMGKFGVKQQIPFRSAEELKKMDSWHEFLEKRPYLKRSFMKLSEQQLGDITMAGISLDGKPLILFDEPLANLDPSSGDLAMKFIDDLHRVSDTTVLIIEHRLEDVLAQPIDRILLFSGGRLIADATPEEILRTEILSDIGIREPLYITAMRYAGVDLDNVRELANVKKVNGPQLKEQMESWLNYLPQFRYPDYDEVLLELDGLSFKYPWNDEDIVDGAFLRIYKGEMISLVGANGAGKSTLSRLMTGEEKPQSGHIYWKGQEVSDINADEAENYVGYVPQNPKDSLSQETVYEEIALKLKQRNMPEEEIVRKVDEVAKVCGLQYIKDLPLSMLSFGQLKRVSIAAVLALDPELIILDEPAAGQDFSHYKDIMHFLQQIHQNGVTVVIVTHDMHLMLEYTRRAVVMAKGKIVADTSSAFVLINPRLIQIASLKETTLFTFANQIGMTDPYSFTEKFVYYDRAARLF